MHYPYNTDGGYYHGHYPPPPTRSVSEEVPSYPTLPPHTHHFPTPPPLPLPHGAPALPPHQHQHQHQGQGSMPPPPHHHQWVYNMFPQGQVQHQHPPYEVPRQHSHQQPPPIHPPPRPLSLSPLSSSPAMIHPASPNAANVASVSANVPPQLDDAFKLFTRSEREQFPVKLYTMLELSALPQGLGIGCSHSVAWLPHGRALKIIDELEFMEVVAPMFFKQTKIRSFYRQLYLWGFKKVTKGRDAGAWHHEHFRRGDPDEMRQMERIKIKGAKSRSNKRGGPGPSQEKEYPDYYSMPLSPPLSSLPSPSSSVTKDKDYVAPIATTGAICPIPRRATTTCEGPGGVSPSRSLPAEFEHSQSSPAPPIPTLSIPTLSRSISLPLSGGSSSLQHSKGSNGHVQQDSSATPPFSYCALVDKSNNKHHRDNSADTSVDDDTFQQALRNTDNANELEPLSLNVEVPFDDDFADHIGSMIQGL